MFGEFVKYREKNGGWENPSCSNRLPDNVLLLQPNVAIVGFGEIQSGFLLGAAFVLDQAL
jgi:hypothetical protein